ncbi:hypothetical protein HID58_085619, partial [Brassica napus]
RIQKLVFLFLKNLVHDYEAHSLKFKLSSSSKGVTKTSWRSYLKSRFSQGSYSDRLSGICWKRWVYLYEDNLEASVALLKTLVEE